MSVIMDFLCEIQSLRNFGVVQRVHTGHLVKLLY